MNIRILTNIVLAITVFGTGLYLILQKSFFLGDRWNPETGLLFSGLSLYLLAAGLFFLSAFTASVARAWMRKKIPMPPTGTIRPHPDYRGNIILEYWYLVVPAIILILFAFVIADRVPNPDFDRVMNVQVLLIYGKEEFESLNVRDLQWKA